MHDPLHGIADPSHAVHRSILCVDVQGYGRRTNRDQLAVRSALFKALPEALADSGVPPRSLRFEDRGDGALVLVQPDVPKERLAGPFPLKLAASLERHNGGAPPGARIQVRVAVHAGEVIYDAHGVAGSAIVAASRLLDAEPLKDALRASPGAVALIASTWFYEEVVQQCPTCDAAAYRPVHVSVKETSTRGWVRLLAPTTMPPASPPGTRPEPDRRPRRGRRRRRPARHRRTAQPGS